MEIYPRMRIILQLDHTLLQICKIFGRNEICRLQNPTVLHDTFQM